MKRIAVNVRPERVDGLIAALRGLKLEVTIHDVKGSGKEKERVTSGSGTGTAELVYTTRKLVITVVDAGREGDVIDAIKGELAGKAGRVVVMVSTVDYLLEF